MPDPGQQSLHERISCKALQREQSDKPNGMVWFFERSVAFIRCKTREDDTGKWALVVVEASGAERVERFENGDELEVRIRRLHHGFHVAGWFGPHGHFIKRP